MASRLGIYVQAQYTLYILPHSLIQTYFYYICLLFGIAPYDSYSLLLVSIQFFNLHALKLHILIHQHSDWVTLALQLNNAHIIYYHMDKTWSVGLAWRYFTHFDCLVIQSCIHNTCIYPETINQTVYSYVKFFLVAGLHTSGCPMCLHNDYSQSYQSWMAFHWYRLPAL